MTVYIFSGMCYNAPRMMYLLRTAPCTNSPELLLYDDLLRSAVSETLSISLSEESMAPDVTAGQMGRHRSKESSTTGTFCLPGISCLYHRPHSESSSHLPAMQSHQKLSLDQLSRGVKGSCIYFQRHCSATNLGWKATKLGRHHLQIGIGKSTQWNNGSS